MDKKLKFENNKDVLSAQYVIQSWEEFFQKTVKFLNGMWHFRKEESDSAYWVMEFVAAEVKNVPDLPYADWCTNTHPDTCSYAVTFYLSILFIILK